MTSDTKTQDTKTQDTKMQDVKTPTNNETIVKNDFITLVGIVSIQMVEDFMTKKQRQEAQVTIPHLDPLLSPISLRVKTSKDYYAKGARFTASSIKKLAHDGVKGFPVDVTIGLRSFFSDDTGKIETAVDLLMRAPWQAESEHSYIMTYVSKKTDGPVFLDSARERLNVTKGA